MADLTLQRFSTTAAGDVTFTAADVEGDTIPNPRGKAVLIVENDSAGAVTVKADASIPCNHGVYHNLSYDVGAGEIALIPLHKRLNSETDIVSVTYTAVESVTVAAVEIS